MTSAWGKLEFDEQGEVRRVQSLVDHSRDVAFVLTALLRLPAYRSRAERIAGRPLTEGDIARLGYLASLHDCGKVNSGFQARRRAGAPRIGHIAPLAALFGEYPDVSLAESAAMALNSNVLQRWGDAVEPLLHVMFSHHGRPWPADDRGADHAAMWRKHGDWDPMLELRRLREVCDVTFPAAHAQSTPPLPIDQRFHHLIAGLVQLADWIASSDWLNRLTPAPSDAWAVQQLRRIGLDARSWRDTLAGRAPSFESTFGSPPYRLQSEAATAKGNLCVLESETGSGKTEAALWRFLELFRAGEVDGLYFALPTRTAASQIHARVTQFAARIWPTAPPSVILAVPGYLTHERAGALPDASDALDAVDGDARSHSNWASQHPKRYFTGFIGVGTIDQALLAGMLVKHAHLRGASLLRLLLVVDEVHASDAYMRRLLEQLLRDHIGAGGHSLLLSATLGSEARTSLLTAASGRRPRDESPPTIAAALSTPYPLLTITDNIVGSQVALPLSRGDREVAVRLEPHLDDPAEIARLALEGARDDGCVLVIRNSVAGAVEVQRALERLVDPEDPVLFRVEGVATLHHGRFARADRRALDAAVERRMGRKRTAGPLVLVGTQTLEQSLDIDADLLISDLCPIDVLLQRIGRLHRHERAVGQGTGDRPAKHARARALVLVPEDGLSSFLPARRSGQRRRHGLGHARVGSSLVGVYPDLCILEATRRLIASAPEWRIPAMNRFLVESAVHSEAIEALVSSLPSDQQTAWREHRQRVEGHTLAMGAIASDGLLRRDEDFMRQPFLDDSQLTTRLGANDRLVDVPGGPVGPFGFTVDRLSVPGWMLRRTSDDAPCRVTARPDRDGFELQVGDTQLVYDRMGLRLQEDA